MRQSNNNYLSHYGVVGMKWGVVKKRPSSKKTSSKKKSLTETYYEQKRKKLLAKQSYVNELTKLSKSNKKLATADTDTSSAKLKNKTEKLKNKDALAKAKEDTKLRRVQARNEYREAKRNEKLNTKRAKNESKKADIENEKLNAKPKQSVSEKFKDRTTKTATLSKKDAAVMSGKASDVLKNAEKMTNDELRKSIERIELNQRLNALSKNEPTKMKKAMDRVSQLTSYATTMGNAYNVAAKTQNLYADIYNAKPGISNDEKIKKWKTWGGKEKNN